MLFINDEHMARIAPESIDRKGGLSISQAAHWAMNLGDEELTSTLYTKIASSGRNNIGVIKGLKLMKGAEKTREKLLPKCSQANRKRTP